MHSWGDTCKAGLDFPPGRSGSPEAENWICGEATLPFMLSVPQAEVENSVLEVDREGPHGG